MILLTLYDERVKLVIRCTAGWFEWLVLPSHTEDVSYKLAYAYDWELSKREAVGEGRRSLEFWSTQLDLVK